MENQQNKKSCMGSMLMLCKDFLVNSSMPGLKYIGGDQRYLIERFVSLLIYICT